MLHARRRAYIHRDEKEAEMRTPNFSMCVSFGVAAIAMALIAACMDVNPTGPQGAEADIEPQMLINGEDDFGHLGTAAIMTYDPGRPVPDRWRSFCSGALIHRRVVQTAGHCIQFLQADLEAGRTTAAWVSFQHHPHKHFNADPAVADPALAGWYEIESLRNNPDNPDWNALRQAPPEEVLDVWGRFHDSGAIVLTKAVREIRPMTMVKRPGRVADLLDKERCGADNPERGRRGCNLLIVSYGLREFPPTTVPALQARHSALVRYEGMDRRFIATFDDPPGSEFGANCFGDSGAPLILLKPNGTDRKIVAISSSPADPFGPPCATGALQYRVDTESHIRFITGVIRSVEDDRRDRRSDRGR
jgi:hypothetical protein